MPDYNQIFFDQYNALNSAQKEAVDAIEGPVMVLAGPGTGKTQILALRIGKILQETQMQPFNILCLTFTESAVSEMRERLVSFIGPAAYYVRIVTFHGFCNDVIREFPEKFLFARGLDPLSDLERVQVFRGIIDELPADSIFKPFGDPYFYCRDFQGVIQQLKREDIPLEAYEKIIEGIEEFRDLMKEKIEEFGAIHGRILRAQDLESFYKTIDEIREKSICHSNLFDFLKKMFSDYFDAMPEDHKAEKKARTLLKNQTKDFWRRVVSDFPKQCELIKVFSAYQTELKRRGRYDFEDMILFVVDKFKNDSELRAYYQERFQYILVDEYQDTNGAQNEIVRLLGLFYEAPNVFVVGDDKQSIYRFQGASMENMLSFYEFYKDNLSVISLKENYRSHQLILDAADSLIQNNRNSITRYIPKFSDSLKAQKDSSDKKIEVLAFDTISEEDYFLVKKVQELIDSGVQPADIAIFYREHRDSKDIVDLFLRLKVPFRLEAGEDVLKDHLIGQLLTLLKFLTDMNDQESLVRILHFDFIGLNFLDVMRIVYYAGNKRLDVFSAISDRNVLNKAGVLNPDRFLNFWEKLAEWQKKSDTLVLTDFFELIVKESGLLNYILGRPDNLELINRLSGFFNQVKAMTRSNHRLGLKEFFNQIELLRENNIAIISYPLATGKDAVRLMTAHKSKGMEFDYVFIVKCVDKNFGNKKMSGRIHLPFGVIKNDVSHKIAEQNEDERRLFYVCMTRARKGIYITYSKVSESGRSQSPAIFVHEIDEQYKVSPDTTAISEESLERLRTVFLDMPLRTYEREHRSFLSAVVSRYVMTVTHLNNYLECPWKFYYQNLLKVPTTKTPHLCLGTAVHEALRDIFLLASRREEPSKDYFLSRFEHHLEQEILSVKDFRHALEHGKLFLERYYDRYSEEFGDKKVLLEYNFRSHRIHLGAVPITGKLDKIEILDPLARTVNVVDYKTGNPNNKFKKVATGGNYRRQIVFYKLLGDLSALFPYSMVSGEIDFVEPTKKGDFKKVKMEISRPEIEALKEMIVRVYDEIVNLSFLDRPGCGECEWCDQMVHVRLKT